MLSISHRSPESTQVLARWSGSANIKHWQRQKRKLIKTMLKLKEQEFKKLIKFNSNKVCFTPKMTPASILIWLVGRRLQVSLKVTCLMVKPHWVQDDVSASSNSWTLGLLYFIGCIFLRLFIIICDDSIYSKLKCCVPWMNEWCIYIALYCVLLYTESTLQSCGGGLSSTTTSVQHLLGPQRIRTSV